LGTVLRIARRRPLVFAKVNLTLSLLPVIATPALAREAFFSADFPDQELRGYWKLMQDESYMAFLDMVALDLPHPAKVKTPLLILGAARDNMLRPSDIAATARAYHTRFEIIPDVAHNSMLEPRWRTVAQRILVWLNAVVAPVAAAVLPGVERGNPIWEDLAERLFSPFSFLQGAASLSS
jgi:pimeloyl-ACP methyl ester carboxylesterase